MTSKLEKERWLSNELSCIGAIVGIVLAFAFVLAFRATSDTAYALIPFAGICAGGLAGHLLAKKIISRLLPDASAPRDSKFLSDRL